MKKTVVSITLMTLLISLTTFCEDFQIIQKSNDGRYYLDENTVMLLANYIKKLEDLNANYEMQISNLEEQVANLRDLLTAYEQEIDDLTSENEKLKHEVETLSWQRSALGIVTAITVGAVIILFLK